MGEKSIEQRRGENIKEMKRIKEKMRKQKKKRRR